MQLSASQKRDTRMWQKGELLTLKVLPLALCFYQQIIPVIMVHREAIVTVIAPRPGKAAQHAVFDQLVQVSADLAGFATALHLSSTSGVKATQVPIMSTGTFVTGGHWNVAGDSSYAECTRCMCLASGTFCCWHAPGKGHLERCNRGGMASSAHQPFDGAKLFSVSTFCGVDVRVPHVVCCHALKVR